MAGRRLPGRAAALRCDTVPARPLTELVEAGWATALAPVASDIAAMGEFLRAELAAGRSYLPSGSNVLRAFQQPFADVRVLIVGQDPYPTPGHPVGLSFSVAPQVQPVPRSLQNIYRELHDEQGVLLLNRVLTVQPGRSGSHAGKGWERVTDQAVRALAARDEPLVAILWGRQAQSLEPLLSDADCLKSVHPSPLSASGGFFGSRPFSRANELLVKHG